MSEYIFKLPDLGEGTVESEIAEWFISVGEQVNEEDVVGTMMTDKAAVELSSPVSGKVLKLAGEPGDIVAVGAPLVIFETDAAAAAESSPPAPSPQAAEEPQPEPVPVPAQAPAAPQMQTTTLDRKRIMTSPAIRRRAKDMGVDLALVPGSGPGGRITRTDFDQYIKRQAAAVAPVAAAPAARATEVKVIGLRRIIAERMSEAKREIPHFAYVEEIDITELEALRKHLNSKKTDPSERLTLLPFLGLALIRALRDFPQCNTTYDKARNVLLRHGAVHLGIATQTPDGLKVPVVQNAHALSMDALTAEIRRVSQAAKDNSARKEELSGSTITITSLGKLGGIVSTPVINQPEVAIIGVNRAVERPVVVDGQVAVRLMMNLSSSFDHRFVDGYDAAAMIQSIKEMLEHPATIFLP
ncbi:MAG: 2-oxo acid dehydrogenase subunit E2 [Gammaproteobacteria bacterium]|jgi:2-oxoisovalerate dehydrogenase E2 component (dihydrolipoyl transacylase)|nr:2-oxo acid dehydrogenase subunit E2 [Gammaproteobacteria bacterium]